MENITVQGTSTIGNKVNYQTVKADNNTDAKNLQMQAGHFDFTPAIYALIIFGLAMLANRISLGRKVHPSYFKH